MKPRDETMHRPLRLAQALVEHAARKAPPALGERLQEEWLADMATRRDGFSQLRFALGCCWATRVIAHEFLAPVPASGGTLRHRALAVFSRPDVTLFSRRTTVLCLIIALHLAVIYAFATGVAHRVITEFVQPTFYRVLDPPPHAQPPPPPPPAGPVFKSGPLERIDGPVIHFQSEVPAGISQDPVIERTESTNQTATGSARTAVRVPGGPGRGFPDAEDFYPTASMRSGETGVATVRVCADSNGRLTEPPQIARSSGIARLDDGALALARAGSGHYRSTTEDGRPVADCYPFRVRFQLRD